MKKFLVVVLTLLLAGAAAELSAKSSSSGRSFGSSSFKSIGTLKTTAPTTAPATAGTATAPATRSSTGVSTFSPPMFFWFPVWGTGGTAGQTGGEGWLLVLIVGGAVAFFWFRARRTVVAEGQDDTEELELFYQRSQKNLNHLATVYVEGQTWLERLEGKIPTAQYNDWNDRYTRISIADFTDQLRVIRGHLDKHFERIVQVLEGNHPLGVVAHHQGARVRGRQQAPELDATPAQALGAALVGKPFEVVQQCLGLGLVFGKRELARHQQKPRLQLCPVGGGKVFAQKPDQNTTLLGKILAEGAGQLVGQGRQ